MKTNGIKRDGSAVTVRVAPFTSELSARRWANRIGEWVVLGDASSAAPF